MSNENNIQNFDNFFKESFGNFQPEPPPGVFEAIQSQIGAAPASGVGAGAQTLAKIAKIGLGKIITGAVAAIAVASTVYFATNTSDKTTVTNTNGKEQQAPVVENTTKDEHAVENMQSIENQSAKVDNANNETSTTNDNSTTASSLNHGNNNGGSGSFVNTQTTTNSQQAQSAEKVNPSADDAKSNNTNNNIPQTNKQIISMYLSGSIVCPNDVVTITLADDVSKTRYKVNFGDGSIVTSVPGTPITHKYKKAGIYKVVANDVNGTKTTREQILKVNTVKAECSVENVDKATYRFINSSICDGTFHTYNWFFGDDGTSTETSPTHTYKSFEMQEYKVKLIAISDGGCVDSFITTVKPTYTYADFKPIVPNVFSPNEDGINDRFDIGIRNEEKYHLVVFDRHGNKVFESFEKDNTWDGHNQYTGEVCTATTYVMVFVYKIKGFDEQKVNGTIDIKR